MITLESILESLKNLVQEEFEFPPTCANTWSSSKSSNGFCAKCTKENIENCNISACQEKSISEEDSRPNHIYERIVNEFIVPLERQVGKEKALSNSHNRKIPTSDDDIVNEMFKTVGSLDSISDRLEKEYHNHITKILEDTLTKITNQTGKYLHALGRNSQPKQETVKDIIAAVPASLSYENHIGKLPIHSAIWFLDSLEYIPMLAKEGVEYNVGGEHSRGGLLVEDADSICSNVRGNKNVLQFLSILHNDTADLDRAYLETIMQLRKINLFLKEDICDYQLLCSTCHPGAELRFEYLFDWLWHIEWPIWPLWQSEDSENSNTSRRRSTILA